MLINSLLIYGSTFILSIYFAWLYQNPKALNNRYIKIKTPSGRRYARAVNYILILFFPVLISSIRDHVGTDFANYLRYYNKFSGPDINLMQFPESNMEPLYGFINYLTYHLTFGQEWALFFITSLLMTVLIVKALADYDEHLSLPMGLFIYFMSHFITSLNIMRQMIAVLIVLNAFRFILEDKRIKYILMILLASMFHNTALLCLPLFLLNFESKPYAKKIKTALYIFVLISPALIHFIFAFSEYIPLLNSYMEIYTYSFSRYGVGFLIDIGFILGPLILFKNDLMAVNPKYDFFINLGLISIPVRLMSYHSVFASRLFFYFSISEVLTIPIIFYAIRDKNMKKWFKLAVIVLFLAFFVYKFIVFNSAEAFPYKSIFS